MPREGVSLWWFSRIVEKSPLKSDAYRSLISLLARGKRSSGQKGFVARIKGSGIAHFCAGAYRICEFIARVVYIRASMGNGASRRKSLTGKDYCLFSYFPLVNEELAKRGIFENGYVAPFHRSLEKKCPDRYSHIFFQIDGHGYDLKGAVRLAKGFAARQSVFFLEEFVTASQVARLIWYYIYFSLVFIFCKGRLKERFVYRHAGADYDVWEIFRDDAYRSFCGPSLASAIWNILAFNKAIAGLDRTATAICICEMQWWERALYAAAKRRGIRTVGVQHTIVPELLLNYFNDPREIAGAGQSGGCPLPDYIAAAGKVSAGMFMKNGWPPERVFVWGAQRFEPLRQAASSPVPWSGKENYFVCVFSVNVADTRRLLALIQEAFAGVTQYRIIIRGHPAADLKGEMRRMRISLDEAVFDFTDRPLHDIVRKAKGVILVSSSSCFYALAADIPVIVPLFADSIDYNPLSYITDIPVYTYSAEELRSTCDGIMSTASSPCPAKKNRESLDNYLYFPKEDGDYLEKIRALR